METGVLDKRQCQCRLPVPMCAVVSCYKSSNSTNLQINMTDGAGFFVSLKLGEYNLFDNIPFLLFGIYYRAFGISNTFAICRHGPPHGKWHGRLKTNQIQLTGNKS